MKPNETESKVKVEHIYGVEHAKEVVQAAIEDYNGIYGLQRKLTLKGLGAEE